MQFNAAPGEFKKSEIGRAALAEFGSIQVEFLALSRRCSNATYGEKAEALVKVLHDNYPDQVIYIYLCWKTESRLTTLLAQSGPQYKSYAKRMPL